MTQQPSLMSLIGQPSRSKEFEELVASNTARIMADESQPDLQKQLSNMAELVSTRNKQNIITQSQCMPYLELFGRTDVTDVSVEDRHRRRLLFDRYVKTLINPQEITIILSEDRKFVVGVHDRIFRKIKSANPGEETLRINATIQMQQERKNADAAGAGAKELAAEVARANTGLTNDADIRKTTLDSVLVRVIQKRIEQAHKMGLPGAPYEEPCKQMAEIAGVPEKNASSDPSDDDGYDDDTTVLS